jgi:hypothetical protein
MVGDRGFVVGLLVFLGSFCLIATAGDRAGGSIRLTSESINSGGVSFSTGATISLGGTVGQPFTTKSIHAGETSLTPGFWSQIPTETKPRGTLFRFR